MIKKAIWIIVILGILFFVLKVLEWSIESNFQDRLNSNPDRTYNITYSDFDLDNFFRGVTLDKVSITPINTPSGNIISGKVNYASVNGLVWTDLLFGKRLNIDEIDFVQPEFEVILSTDTIRKQSGKGLQEMFGDILSRAELNSFRIQNGSIIIKNANSQDIKGEIKRINIVATEIETDTKKFKNIIPFQVGNLSVDLEGATFKPNDYTDISLGSLHYNLMDTEILLNDISLDYSIDWIEVSKRVGFQTDIIGLNVKEIGIHQFEPSNDFYTQLDIVAQEVSIDELNIKLQRNKNISRPSDAVMPMFQGIINTIPVEILIDTIQISNSSLTYGELGLKKSESGSIKIQNINGNITDITNMPNEQIKKGQLNAKISARLLGEAEMNVDLSVPYDNDTFSIAVDVGEMNLTNLNPSIKPLAGVEVGTGQMQRILFQMNASPVKSHNKLVFDYNDLHVTLINEKSKNKSKKRVLLSAIANAAIRANNIPGQDKYLIAEYQSERNVNRSPINYIIHSLVNGFKRIVPSQSLQSMIKKEKRKSRKK